MPDPEKSFFSEYNILNSNTEIPPVFSIWCAISAISASLGRRLSIDMGSFKVYPNMYIILIAGSGRMRKSTAVGVTKNLLQLMSPRINMIAQKLTPEALLQALKSPTTSADKKVISISDPTGQGFVLTDELTNFLNRSSNDGGIVPMLIELYDCQSEFTYHTMSRGKETLRDTQLGLLAATTPEELRKAIPEEVIGSGLASRILFIYESTPAAPISRPVYSPRQIEAKEYCVRFLQRISCLSGPVHFESECEKWLDVCYRERCWKSKLLDDPHLRGYASRRYIHILKLSITMSIGFSEKQIVTVKYLEKAEDLIMMNERHLQRVVQLVTMNEKGSVIQFVLSIIDKHGEISKHELVRTMSHRLDSREITEVIETLIKSNQVKAVVQGSNILYRSLRPQGD